MKATALSLSALITSIILLVTGNAFLTTLLGLRLSMEGFSTTVIGWTLVFYSIGFVAGTLYAERIIIRAGHVRAFAVFAAILAAAILIHPMSVKAGIWGALRAVAGFVMAGLMIVMESWFSSRASNHNRASLFAIYQVVFFLSTTAGQVLIRLGDPSDYVPFSLAAILVILAVTPLSMTRQASPVIEHGQRMTVRQLYRTSPIGTLGALVAGLLISAFYTMGPVYADRMNLDVQQISTFMASAIVAAMLLAWPIGRLCDRFDRYRVILVAAGVAALCSLATALLGAWNLMLLWAIVGLYMGISAALYPIAVAITNDLMETHQITAASTALLLSYGIGSCIGPVISAAFMEFMGPSGLFVSNTVILSALIVVIVALSHHVRSPVEAHGSFYTTVPEASLGVDELDPRNAEHDSSSEAFTGYSDLDEPYGTDVEEDMKATDA